MDIPADALGFAVVLATLLGTAVGVKLLVWGKGPIRRSRMGSADPGADERLDAMEDRVQALSALLQDQSQLLEDVHERLDFTERMLAQHRLPKPSGTDSPDTK